MTDFPAGLFQFLELLDVVPEPGPRGHGVGSKYPHAIKRRVLLFLRRDPPAHHLVLAQLNGKIYINAALASRFIAWSQAYVLLM